MSRERRAPPAFQVYAADFLADHVDWSNIEIGIAMRLRAYQWRYGALPTDMAVLVKISRCSRRDFERAWSVRLANTFTTDGCGGYADPRLEEQRAASLAYAQRQSNNAKSRWGDGQVAFGVADTGDPEWQGSSTASVSASAGDHSLARARCDHCDQPDTHPLGPCEHVACQCEDVPWTRNTLYVLWIAVTKTTPTGNTMVLQEATTMCMVSAQTRGVRPVVRARQLLQAYGRQRRAWRTAGRPAGKPTVEQFVRLFAGWEEIADGDFAPELEPRPDGKAPPSPPPRLPTADQVLAESRGGGTAAFATPPNLIGGADDDQ